MVESLDSRVDSSTRSCCWPKYSVYVRRFIVKLKTAAAALTDTEKSRRAIPDRGDCSATEAKTSSYPDSVRYFRARRSSAPRTAPGYGNDHLVYGQFIAHARTPVGTGSATDACRLNDGDATPHGVLYGTRNIVSLPTGTRYYIQLQCARRVRTREYTVRERRGGPREEG